MAQIIGKDSKYVNTAVLAPVFKTGNQHHFLFQKRSAEIRQAGEISFPGGKIDRSKKENPRETAIRETVEEMGVNRNKIHVKKAAGTLVSLIGVSVDVFLGYVEINSPKDLNINRAEVERAFSIPLKWFTDNQPETYKVKLKIFPFDIDENRNKTELFPARDLGLPPKYQKPWGESLCPIYVYKTEFGPIWGITAEIIKECLDQILAMIECPPAFERAAF